MTDPVIAADGHTYEREQIEMWFRSHRKSPKTNEALDDLRLIPNYALKNLIADFKSKHPMYAREDASPKSSAPSLVRSVSNSLSNLGAAFRNQSSGISSAPLQPPQPLAHASMLRQAGGGPATAAGLSNRATNSSNAPGLQGAMTERERRLLDDTRSSGVTDNVPLVDRYRELLATSGAPRSAGSEGENGSSVATFSAPFVMALAEVIKNHPNAKLRGALIACISSYASALDPSISQMDALRVRDTVFNSLLHCGRTDTDTKNREVALESIFSIFSAVLPEKIDEVANYYIERLRVESEPVGGAFGAIISLFSSPNTDIVCTCIRCLARTDSRLSPQREARPEYGPFLLSSTARVRGEAISAMLSYRSIPEEFGEVILNDFLTVSSTSRKETCVAVLFRHGRSMRNLYPRIVVGMVQTVENGANLNLQWQILEGVCAFRDPHPLIVNMLITKLASTEQGFLWWNYLSKAAATSVLSLTLRSQEAFSAESIAVIRSREDFLRNLRGSIPANDRDVQRAICVLLQKVDPTVSVPGDLMPEMCSIM
jgi:hypothetical protein